MNSPLVPAAALAAVFMLLVAMACGASIARDSLADQCQSFGSMKVNGKVYECREVRRMQ